MLRFKQFYLLLFESVRVFPEWTHKIKGKLRNIKKLTLQGDYIWIEPISGREFDVAIGARVISAEGRRIQVKDDDNKVSFNKNFRHIPIYLAY